MSINTSSRNAGDGTASWPAVLRKASIDSYQYLVFCKNGLRFIAESATPADEAGAFVLFKGVRMLGAADDSLSLFLDRGLTVALDAILLVAEATS